MLKNNFRTPFKKKTGYQEENRVSAECFHAIKKGTALAVPFSMIPG